VKKKKQVSGPQISHLFQVQLRDSLTKAQVDRIASAIRGATKDELLEMDFRIEELTPLFKRTGGTGQLSNCGGGCGCREG
jgi:hypothetical protein